MLGNQIAPNIAAIAKKRMMSTLRNQEVDESSLSQIRNSEGKKHERTTDYQVSMEVGLKPTTYNAHKKILAQVQQEAPDLMPFIETID